MKSKFIVSLLLLTIINSEISNTLWSEEMITNISKVNYISEDELLVYSDRGILSRIDNQGNSIWRKNLVYNKFCKLLTERQCIII